jgi:hypothetical protein
MSSASSTFSASAADTFSITRHIFIATWAKPSQLSNKIERRAWLYPTRLALAILIELSNSMKYALRCFRRPTNVLASSNGGVAVTTLRMLTSDKSLSLDTWGFLVVPIGVEVGANEAGAGACSHQHNRRLF